MEAIFNDKLFLALQTALHLSRNGGVSSNNACYILYAVLPIDLKIYYKYLLKKEIVKQTNLNKFSLTTF